jgi:centromere/kinetochore protein ZW10
MLLVTTLSSYLILFLLGNLVDTIFTLLLDPILAAEAITDAASWFVHSLFLDAARGSAEVFLVGESSTTHPATSTAETNQQIKVAIKYSMLFEKLQCIGQFMVMRLDDITRGLEEGVFRSVTGKELTHLVTATYDESAKCNALLKVLASR